MRLFVSQPIFLLSVLFVCFVNWLVIADHRVIHKRKEIGRERKNILIIFKGPSAISFRTNQQVNELRRGQAECIQIDHFTSSGKINRYLSIYVNVNWMFDDEKYTEIQSMRLIWLIFR